MYSYICRGCMCQSNRPDEVVQIFDIFKNVYYLPLIISELFKVKIDLNDPMTKTLCRTCAEKIIEFHQFFIMYVESDQKLRDLLSAEGGGDGIKTEDSLFEEAPKFELADNEEKHVEDIFVETPKTYEKILKWECSNCRDRFKTKRLLTKHTNNCEKPSTSSDVRSNSSTMECDNEGESDSSVLEDIKEEAIAADEEGQEWQCKNCQTNFASSDLLMDHHKTCSLAIKMERPFKTKNPDANGNWICEKCGEAFPSKLSLREHRKTHREPKKYTENKATGEFSCDVCAKSFDSKEKIQFHVRRHGDIKCLCNVCGKWLSCRDNLNKHYRAVHLNEKKHVCPICDHRFTSSFRLKDHVNSHKGIRAYSCELCPTRFFNCSAVKRHMDTVHSDEKKYVCNVCSKAFKLPTNLKTHMFAHTGIYEHTCEHCGTGFRRKNKMLQHIQEFHNIST